MADRMGTLKIKCSITTGGGPLREARLCQSVSKKKKKEKKIKKATVTQSF